MAERKTREDSLKEIEMLFQEPPKKPRGWFSDIARRYIEILIKAVENGTTETSWLKIPPTEYKDENEKQRLYNAVTSMKRRSKYDVDIHIIEDNLWIHYLQSNI